MCKFFTDLTALKMLPHILKAKCSKTMFLWDLNRFGAQIPKLKFIP